MNKSLILCLSLLSISVFSQNPTKIIGSIVDKATGEKISGVSVYDSFYKQGTVSNEQGEFGISINPDSSILQFTHVSYLPQTMTKMKFDNVVIEMVPAIITLKEILVTDNEALKFMRLAIEKAWADSSKLFYAKAFYQMTSKVNNEYTRIHEIFFDAGWNVFGISQWHPTQARFAQTESLRFTYRNISLLAFNFFGVLIKNQIASQGKMPNANYDVSQYYDFKIEKFINEGTNAEIAIIKCLSKKTKKNECYFDGVVLIQTSNFNIVKIQGDIFNLMNFTGPAKIYFKGIHLDMNFKESSSTESSLLDYGSFTLMLEFKDNFLIKRKITENVKLILYKIEDHPVIPLKPFDSRDDLEIIKNTKYDPTFWFNNEVVHRTPLEKEVISSFEKQKKFGNYFNK